MKVLVQTTLALIFLESPSIQEVLNFLRFMMVWLEIDVKLGRRPTLEEPFFNKWLTVKVTKFQERNFLFWCLSHFQKSAQNYSLSTLLMMYIETWRDIDFARFLSISFEIKPPLTANESLERLMNIDCSDCRDFPFLERLGDRGGYRLDCRLVWIKVL